MAKASPKSAAAKTATHITCHAPDAKKVFVSGSFNDWNPADLAMTKNAGGEWAAELYLAPGRYEYKFHVDGVWCCEPHLRNDGCAEVERVPNPFGSMNRVLLVR